MKPTRKEIRLKDYDYSENGAYFITFCTKDHKQILSRVAVGTSLARPPAVMLTEIGECVQNSILRIPVCYPGVSVDYYVIMPNHVHMILRAEQNRQTQTISRIVQQTKGVVTKQVGRDIWQGRFYDHVIRDENDYLIRAKYIEDNPAKWAQDDYYAAGMT